jgi:hypothetical protein
MVDKIVIDKQGQTIDYTGLVLECDLVILTATLQVLKDGHIKFNSSLSTERLDQALTPAGFKAFLKFSETFYPVTFGFAKYFPQINRC